MGLIFGIIIAIGTVVVALLIVFADSMSDAPSVQGISPIPALVIGGLISAALIFTHFYHLSW